MTDGARLRHVCVFMANVTGGGAERMMVNLASGLADLGIRVDLVLAEAVGPFLADVGPNVRVVDLARRNLRLAILPLARYLRRERPQILFTTLGYTSVGAVLAHAAARSHARLIIREASTPSQRRTGTPKEVAVALLSRMAYRYAHAVVAVSRGVADDLRQHGDVTSDKVTVLGNPVVTPDIAGKAARPAGHAWLDEPGPPVVLGVGRLQPEKGFETLLCAFARVRARRPARLVILGEGAERGPLLALARSLRVDADVDLPGFVENPFAFMARAGVFVLASSREGLPGALIQAMATGCPVVATDCRSGPAEILEGGRYGRLVPVGDAESMAEAITTTLDHPPPAELVEQASARFTSGQVVRAYRDFFQKCL